MRTVKQVLRPERLRQMPEQFSWVDQALVQRHFIDRGFVLYAVTLAAARSDPLGFVADLPAKCILDEVQRAPGIFSSLKMAVDANRTPGRFLLTGSANVLLVPALSDSLAGRLGIQRLYPLAQSELAEHRPHFLETLFGGRFPAKKRPRLGRELAALARQPAEPADQDAQAARGRHRHRLRLAEPGRRGAVGGGRALLGQMAETFVYQELRRQASWQEEEIRFYHLRDRDGFEVDLVLERPGGELAGVEVKAGATVTAADFRGLHKFRAGVGKHFSAGVVLYDGEVVAGFGERMYAVPLSELWAKREADAQDRQTRSKPRIVVARAKMTRLRELR